LKKILLIGPYPPPHGGISTHVLEMERQWTEAGVRCRVLDARHAGVKFVRELLRGSLTGWTPHIHTNGHNRNSWLLAGLCGLAGSIGGGAALILHSGMAPSYLAANAGRRQLARWTCRLFERVTCASTAIREALITAGAPEAKLEVRNAFVEPRGRTMTPDPSIRAWMRRHSPVFSATLFFRPEYGFDLLAASIARLRVNYPSVGCVVMGSGEQEQEARRRVRESDLDDAILLAGDVGHETCLSIISDSDLFLRPTLADGDSVSVREAVALGTPVVASQAGTRPPEAILFRPGDGEDFCVKIQLALKERDYVLA
jgi:glycogen synthase